MTGSTVNFPSNGGNAGRSGWLEGTLGVISGVAQRSRPGTPVNSSQRQSTFSAPNSPGGVGGPPAIRRLPSQDSLDHSIHNDSGHGNKSTAQIIQDLRKSNARLSARTAAMEADFMNQLNEMTRKVGEHEDRLAQKDAHVSTLEARCKNAEVRIREKDEQLQKVREESAYQRHVISDLRNQMYAKEEDIVSPTKSSGTGVPPVSPTSPGEAQQQWQLEKEQLLRELDSMQANVSREREERMRYKQQITRLQRELALRHSPNHPVDLGSDGDMKKEEDVDENPTTWNQLARTQDALYRTEMALVDLQKEHKNHKETHQERVRELERELENTHRTYEEKEAEWKIKLEHIERRDLAGDLQSQLSKRDEMIEALREQVLDYSSQLTEMTKEMVQVKAEAERQEQYRREEADDLRVLNDAQEEEIEILKKQLEDASKEIKMRDRELQEKEYQTRHSSASNIELEEAKATIEKLRAEQKERKEDFDKQISSLGDTVFRLAEERDALAALTNEAATDVGSPSNFEHEAQVQLMEAKIALCEKDLAKAREELEKVNESKSRIVDDYEDIIAQLKDEKIQVEARYKDQVADMNAELSGLRQSKKHATATLPAGESTSDSISDTKSRNQGNGREDRKSELESLLQAKVEEVTELTEKLEDRDTTISSLVKSSVTLEQQLAASKLEMKALRQQLGPDLGETGYDVILADSATSEQLIEVKSTLASVRESERRLLADYNTAAKQLEEVRKENTRLRSRLEVVKSENILLRSQVEDDAGSSAGSVNASSNFSSSPQTQIQERDAAISNLVQQSIEQDRLVVDLQARLAAVTQELELLRDSNEGGSFGGEVAELRKETEMFAGQVIEQDQEIEALKLALEERDNQLAGVQNEVKVLKEKAQEISSQPVIDVAKVKELSAEVDELKEANAVLRDEIRLLRRKSREYESAASRIDELKQEIQDRVKDSDEFERMIDNLSKEKADLTKALEESKVDKPSDEELRKQLSLLEEESSRTIQVLKSDLEARERAIDELQESLSSAQKANSVDELEAASLKSEVEGLQKSLQHQSNALDSAKQTIRELERMLAEKNSGAAAAWEVEKEELISEIETLTRKLEATEEELKGLEEQRQILDDFKTKLEDADEAREASEKSIVDSYERKLSLLRLDKDVTIDKLRKDLLETKEASVEEIEHLRAELEQCDEEMKAFRMQVDSELQLRESRVFALERTLEAQEQLVANMKSEMDHLQGSMENSAVTRRQEIEDLRQELVDMTALVAKQEREIKGLQGQLEDKRVEYEAKIEKLKDSIAAMEPTENDNDMHRSAADLRMDIRIREVKDELEKLKWRNSGLSEENEKMRSRLERAEAQGFVADQGKVQELQNEVNKQKKRVTELESELSQLRTPPPPSVDKKSVPPSPRRLGFLGRKKPCIPEAN